MLQATRFQSASQPLPHPPSYPIRISFASTLSFNPSSIPPLNIRYRPFAQISIQISIRSISAKVCRTYYYIWKISNRSTFPPLPFLLPQIKSCWLCYIMCLLAVINGISSIHPSLSNHLALHLSHPQQKDEKKRSSETTKRPKRGCRCV